MGEAGVGAGERWTISSNDIRNLNNRINGSFREYARTPCTFNVETEHPQRGNSSPFSLGDMRYDFLIGYLTFNLTVGDFRPTCANKILSRRQLNPVHPDDLIGRQTPKEKAIVVGIVHQYRS